MTLEWTEVQQLIDFLGEKRVRAIIKGEMMVVKTYVGTDVGAIKICPIDESKGGNVVFQDKGGTVLRLTAAKARVFSYLFKNLNQMVGRKELADSTCNGGIDFMRVIICYLRKDLKKIGIGLRIDHFRADHAYMLTIVE